MPIAGGLDIHREQITFDYPGTVTGRVRLAGGRLPQCRVPPGRILEARALLETYHDLRAGHTARARLRGAVPARAPRRWARARCAARRARRRCGLSRPG